MGKYNRLILIAALCACLLLCFGQFWFSDVQTVSWGLHFAGEHAIPSGPDSADTLAKYGGAYLGDPEEPVLYLTFDAGYENGCTEEILDILKRNQVPAAFFLCGNYLQRNPDLVRRMAQEGHIVGNHTMHHPDMSKNTDPAAFAKELQELEELYTSITGQEICPYYRPPQGNYTLENLKQAQALGYHTVLWSLAYADWDNANQPDADQAIEKLTGRIHNGAVVLLHSTSKTNAQILETLLQQWQAMGYRFASLDTLFSDRTEQVGTAK